MANQPFVFKKKLAKGFPPLAFFLPFKVFNDRLHKMPLIK